MDFDSQSERCIDCDGHFRHFSPCPLAGGEPALSLAERVSVQALVNTAMPDAGQDVLPS